MSANNLFKHIGLTWMEREHAKIKLESLLSQYPQSNDIRNRLEMAQWHYMEILGITYGGVTEKEQLLKEQKKYAHLIKHNEGMIVFEEDACVLFMSEQHELSPELCAAYVCSYSW